MSITGAMNAAISGLRAAARGSELVSNNISNALTPSYGRRELELSSLSIGAGGVRISAVNRHMNEGLLADLRLADAGQQQAQGTVDFLRQIEDIVGLAGDANGLSGRLAAFESGLVNAASRPDATERLEAAVGDARRLADGLNKASDAVQDARTAADRQIGVDIEILNRSLQQVHDLNVQITAGLARNGGAAALIDERQAVIDRISGIVPIRVLSRDNGSVALYSEGGAILIDPTPAKIGFEASNLVTPFQTIDNGTLSGITINDQPLRISGLAGGRLSAQFAIRDKLGVEAQTQIDALARDLIERFQTPAVDATRGAGDAGLFTDAGGAFDTVDEVGISGRISINAFLDRTQGGEAWRLRDGLGATGPGPVGDATLINTLKDALNNMRTPASGDFRAGPQSAADLMSNYSGALAARRDGAEQDLSFAAARLNEITQLQAADGVDTDQELQNLLVLEKAYAANARVIQAADDMLETLMRL